MTFFFLTRGIESNWRGIESNGFWFSIPRQLLSIPRQLLSMPRVKKKVIRFFNTNGFFGAFQFWKIEILWYPNFFSKVSVGTEIENSYWVWKKQGKCTCPHWKWFSGSRDSVTSQVLYWLKVWKKLLTWGKSWEHLYSWVKCTCLRGNSTINLILTNNICWFWRFELKKNYTHHRGNPYWHLDPTLELGLDVRKWWFPTYDGNSYYREGMSNWQLVSKKNIF